ncbi:hypothetical protein [Falsiroseomonas tokyonensis]|uniref:Uncharacterized protein n=1 Tax=Falsiroseomonas tokyonensis TaxID=430521 RepID=A0ABV7BSP6_9PROT|nr:hypothetical protein [Falsiroseomonas tokyonensis]MBU8538671.1 hypothetical protein [Falsiroseomonas tokyonensis]
MRPILPFALSGLLLVSGGALAQTTAAPQGQPAPRLVIGAPGSCEMRVNGDPRPCSSGLVYVQHQDGAVLISVQSGANVTIGFEGRSDSQPQRERYILDLARMHTSVSGRSAAKQVTGSCEIEMSRDGRTWHRATCSATDRSNLTMIVTFTGNGSQVTAARPGEAPAAAPRAPKG